MVPDSQNKKRPSQLLLRQPLFVYPINHSGGCLEMLRFPALKDSQASCPLIARGSGVPYPAQAGFSHQGKALDPMR